MPKYIPVESDLYETKRCSYCGLNFYPIVDENYCNYLCQHWDESYREDFDSYLAEQLMEDYR